jgi:hypothetical protein
VEAEELDAQLTTLQYLNRRWSERGAAVETVQRLSIERAGHIAAILPEMLRKKGWTT